MHKNRSITSSISTRSRIQRSTPLALAGLLVTLAWAAPSQAQPQLQASAIEQIRLLQQVKAERSPAQRKISWQLLHALDRQRGAEYLNHLPKLRPSALRAADGTVLVDMTASIDVALLARIESLGGTVINSFPRWDSARLRLPLTALEELAAADAVRNLRAADPYMMQMTNTTEGDVAHGTDDFRAETGLDGSGVKVGSMSDSVEALAALQASGDLPPGVTILPGQAGTGSSEGTALMEIVHDMAPGAELFFATGQGGQAQMAQNILDLAAAGCRIINDDVLYFTEPVFQDGVIAQAVNQVKADNNVIYFSAAGNSGNLDNGTAGAWEGDFAPTALPAPLVGGALAAHDFGGGSNNNEITFDPPFFITLQWTNPFGAAGDDYDLFVLDAALANIVDGSATTQDGDDDPVEIIDSRTRNDLGNRIVVTQFGGDPVFLHLNTHRGMLETATDGQIFGHPAAEGALAVAAVNVATAGGGEFVGGPANPVEPFSSDGPRRIFFNADGSPVATGEALGQLGPTPSTERQKPDIAAADGVSTATPGFNPFFGTSASAPHAAGASALFVDGFESISSTDFADVFKSGALDIDAVGVDRNSGSGLMDLDGATAAMIFADGFESGDAAAWSN